MRTLCLVLVVALALPSARTPAQEPPPRGPEPLFPRVFPRPSRLNGYEDLVLACDWIARNPAIDALDPRTSTLSQKRAAVGSREGVQALNLTRQGLSRDIAAPPLSDDWRLDLFAGFRRLARFLAQVQYVRCADGDVPGAIEALGLGLRLGRLMQSQELFGALTGVAMDAIALRAIHDRADQWSQRDCTRILDLAREWMRLPDPTIAALTSEMSRVLTQLKSLPSATPATIASAQMRFDAVIAELRKPPWLRKSVAEETDPAVRGESDALLQNLTALFDQTPAKFVFEQTMMQMLAVEAGIRAYRWEHNQLPDNLGQLKLGDLIVDPNTGKPFTYQVVDDRSYALSSAVLDADWRPIRKTPAAP
jgi:hypothetical protein